MRLALLCCCSTDSSGTVFFYSEVFHLCSFDFLSFNANFLQLSSVRIQQTADPRLPPPNFLSRNHIIYLSIVFHLIIFIRALFFLLHCLACHVVIGLVFFSLAFCCCSFLSEGKLPQVSAATVSGARRVCVCMLTTRANFTHVPQLKKITQQRRVGNLCSAMFWAGGTELRATQGKSVGWEGFVVVSLWTNEHGFRTGSSTVLFFLYCVYVVSAARFCILLQLFFYVAQVLSLVTHFTWDVNTCNTL